MTSQTSSEMLFHDMDIQPPSTHEDDDEASELNLDLLNASEANIKLELGQKRKFSVKSEPHCIADPAFLSLEPQQKRARTDRNENRKESDSLNPLPTDTVTQNVEQHTNHGINPNTDSTTNSNMNPVANNGTNSGACNPGTVSSPLFLPVVPHPSYYVPVVPNHHSLPRHPHAHPHGHPHGHPMSYGHTIPISPYMRTGGTFYNGPSTMSGVNGVSAGTTNPINSINTTNLSIPKGRNRSRRAPEYEVSSEEESEDDARNFTDKSPFKTTYISRDEERELKNANNALYSQFHLARQSIYQQFQQKVDGIRHSTMICAEKRKLNVKIAAIDAKVQEKKLFLSYLEMTRPQPASWMVSSATLSMNQYNRTLNGLDTNTSNLKEAEVPSLRNDGSSTISTVPNGSNGSNTANTANTQIAVMTSNGTNGSTEGSSAQSKVKVLKMVSRRVKKPKFSDYNVRVLRDWYETHTNNPYPSAAEKHLMCQLTGLTKYQVSRWFCNVRTRKPPPELSDNDEDVDVSASSRHQRTRSRKHGHPDRGRKGPFKVDPMISRPIFGGHDYYGRPTAPHHAAGYRMPMHQMGMAPMNFHGMNGVNPINSMPMTNPHLNFQHIMNQKRMNPRHAAPAAHLKENEVDNATEQTEGLMPPISSSDGQKAQNNTGLLPPPLIDENSNISKQC